MSESQKTSTGRALTQQELLKLARSFHAKKRLGQNFLIDPNELSRITENLELSPGDRVVEIGPGLGFLTRMLVAAGASVTAVELDRECVERLNLLRLPSLEVVHGDFLHYDLRGWLDKSPAAGKLKVVGNVPYQITAPILVRLLGEIGKPSPWLADLDRIVLTVQLEVAERLVASPDCREYSQITLLTNYFTRPTVLKTVPRESFYPAPEVTSAIVKLVPEGKPLVDCQNPRLLRQVIHCGFGQRRKMLKNNLASLGVPPAELLAIFDCLRLDPQARAERLSLEQFAMLTDALSPVVSKPRCESSNA